MVRDKLQELGQQIDHDHSGLVYTPLTHVEVPFTFHCMRRIKQQRMPAVCTIDRASTPIRPKPMPEPN